MNRKRRYNEGAGDSLLIQCANLILPFLHPKDLTSISLTCKKLNTLSKSITIRRSSDASRSFENLPIPFITTTEKQPPYSYFIYTPSYIHQFPPSLYQSWGSSGIENPRSRFENYKEGSLLNGCVCKSESESGSVCGDDCCPCFSSLDSSIVYFECGSGCECGSKCGNRVTQRGVSVRLKIVRDVNKGWGLHASEMIRNGQFVCQYAGELLTTKEARRLQKTYDELSSNGQQFTSALLVVREHLPSGKACLRINIDATRVGNVARFINHSCDGGNLSTVLVRSSGDLIPRLCFFASRDIQEDEELMFSYGEIRINSKGLQCFCGSSCCLGILPSEQI